MARPLDELREVSELLKAPIVVAGDLFDDGWREKRCPPELINFVIRHLPKCFAIPGQHDLPNHVYSEIKRTAYWTLVEAGVVTDLGKGETTLINQDVAFHSFPWGCPIKPIVGDSNILEVAIIHAYIWVKGREHPNAPRNKHISAFDDRLKGYDVAIVGDNHIPFIAEAGDCVVVNSGTFLRRKTDEAFCRPALTLVHKSGRITLYRLDCSKDHLLTKQDLKKVAHSLGETNSADVDLFIQELTELTDTGINFVDQVRRYMEEHETPDSVKRLTLSILSGDDGKKSQ